MVGITPTYHVDYVTVSAKIRRDLHRKLKLYKVPISEVIRRALEEEVARREKEELRRLLERAGEILRKTPAGEVVSAVRSTRDEQ